MNHFARPPGRMNSSFWDAELHRAFWMQWWSALMRSQRCSCNNLLISTVWILCRRAFVLGLLAMIGHFVFEFTGPRTCSRWFCLPLAEHLIRTSTPLKQPCTLRLRTPERAEPFKEHVAFIYAEPLVTVSRMSWTVHAGGCSAIAFFFLFLVECWFSGMIWTQSTDTPHTEWACCTTAAKAKLTMWCTSAAKRCTDTHLISGWNINIIIQYRFCKVILTRHRLLTISSCNAFCTLRL